MKTSRREFTAAFAAAGAVAVVHAPAKAAQFEMKCGSQLPPDHPSSVRLTEMFTAIGRESGGRVHIQLFPNSVLGGDPAMLAQLRVGALQLLSTAAGTLGSVVTVAQISDLGYAFKDEDDAQRVLTGALGTFVRDETTAKGLHLLGYWGSGMKQVGSNTHPIRVPDDFRNFKVKAVGRMAIELFRALGASPVPLTLAETYTGLQTKIIDGQDGPLLTFEVSRFYEVNKYASLTNHAYSANTVVMNGEAWNALPADLQAVVDRNNRKYSALEWRDTKLVARSIEDKLSRQGIVLNKVDQAPFRAKLGAYYTSWASEFGPAAWGALQNAIGRKLA